jgi:hypothetical protein
MHRTAAAFATLEQPRRFHPLHAQAAKASVGPRQRSVSTFLKSGASVRRVVRFLKSSARSRRCRAVCREIFYRTMLVQELGGTPGVDPRDEGVAVGRIAHQRN